MRKSFIIISIVLLGCVSCQRSWNGFLLAIDDNDSLLTIDRFDRVEGRYISTGDFAALQEMSTRYPEQTRTLMEDVLGIGRVNDIEISRKFRHYFQDSTLIQLLRDVQSEYAQMDDVNDEFRTAFHRLQQYISVIHPPMVYTQVGSLDQSIVVGNNMIGICLDKYMGKDYPLYAKYYKPSQREQMTRSMIVPDVLVFYILSLYPMPNPQSPDRQVANDVHMSKIMWVVNHVLERDALTMSYVQKVEEYMHTHNQTTILQLLTEVDYRNIISVK
ncbi:MAG: gliding motility protein GldB [Prevotella sp.]|nr:gliding motility protein GldB [Prevotella sp.]MBO5204397.1 gliding motility protein GldB [Prevotella sp.]